MAENPFASDRAEGLENPFAVVLQALKVRPLEGRPGTIEALYVLHFGSIENPDNLVSGGVAVLETERVFGGDSGYYWTGSYKVDGQTLEANVTVERHNTGWPNVWGDQAPKFDIQFTGRRRDGGSTIEGMRRPDLPHVSLPVTWLRMADLPG